MTIWLTQLQVLVVGQDQDDVRPDVASVSLEAGLQALARLEVGVAERHIDNEEEEESAPHGLQLLSPQQVNQSAASPVEPQLLETNRIDLV